MPAPIPCARVIPKLNHYLPMNIQSAFSSAVLYFLVFLSGAAGLMYQVVWHKYLAILLGAQARATAIVLAIFLGGISAGYFCFGRWSRYKRWNLFLTYGIVEISLGLWAFFFPYLFRLALPATAQLYHLLGVNNLAIDFVMSLLLIGFPTFLMGGTLPLLTQALSPDFKNASRTHAMIYGINTVGACLGCLFAGYWFIPAYNLICTSMIGGIINVTVAMVTYFGFAKWSTKQEVHEKNTNHGWKELFRFSTPQLALVGIGLLSGFYLITLETVLIRLMGLATGSSNYNFTLIVAIFIFGLGIGSILMRGLNRYTPARLFWNQVLVSTTLLGLYCTGDYWSYWVHVTRIMFRDLPEAFYLFQFALGVMFLLLLVVPIGFSGITLPLCFHLIKDKKETLGFRVGQLYGFNTVGCVLGAMFGGYLLFAFFDLDQLFKLCIFASLATVALSAYLYFPEKRPSVLPVAAASALVVLTIAGTILAPRYHHERWIQPFRHSQPLEVSFRGADAFGKFLSRSTEFLYWKDGNNTSVGIGSSNYNGKEGSRTIFVNGKSDGNTRGDYFTTVMLGHIPALLAKKLDSVCVIGFGTGMTVGTLGLYPDVLGIDVAEISDVSIANANYFDNYNYGVSTNPRVRFHEMDAFRYLEGAEKKFDLIVSEPSNPWVAGIENLYSKYFYSVAKRKMTEDGLFVQWIHTYSFDDDLLRMVLRTISSEFANVSVYQLKGGDIAILAHQKPITREQMLESSRRFYSAPHVTRALLEAGIKRFEAVLALEIVPTSLTPDLAKGALIHDLEWPQLSNRAARAFFAGSSSKVQSLRRQFKSYYASVDKSLMAEFLGPKGEVGWENIEAFKFAYCENPISKNNFLCEETVAMAKLINPGYEPNPGYEIQMAHRELASLGSYQLMPRGKFTVTDLQTVYTMFEAYKKYASPLARIPMPGMLARVEQCLRDTPFEQELHGECLLQKILMMETTQDTNPALTEQMEKYLTWFPNADPKSPNYGKLQDAKEILTKMTRIQASQP